jgi:hypothetical protein
VVGLRCHGYLRIGQGAGQVLHMAPSYTLGFDCLKCRNYVPFL